jgi:hypothetical protein
MPFVPPPATEQPRTAVEPTIKLNASDLQPPDMLLPLLNETKKKLPEVIVEAWFRCPEMSISFYLGGLDPLARFDGHGEKVAGRGPLGGVASSCVIDQPTLD